MVGNLNRVNVKKSHYNRKINFFYFNKRYFNIIFKYQTSDGLFMTAEFQPNWKPDPMQAITKHDIKYKFTFYKKIYI